MRMLMIACLVLCAGCGTTGGSIGGLIPAPKFLKGKVENSIYHAADGSFEIRTPYKQGTDSYTYMEVKEQYTDVGAYVSFGLAMNPHAIYRVEIGRRLDKSAPAVAFDDLVAALLDNYKKQLSGYGTVPEERWRTVTTLDAKNALLVTMEQFIPPGRGLQNRSDGSTVLHIIYIVESPNGGGGAVWVQWPHGCNACYNGPESAILSSDERIRSFFESFRLKI